MHANGFLKKLPTPLETATWNRILNSKASGPVKNEKLTWCNVPGSGSGPGRGVGGLKREITDQGRRTCLAALSPASHTFLGLAERIPQPCLSLNCHVTHRKRCTAVHSSPSETSLLYAATNSGTEVGFCETIRTFHLTLKRHDFAAEFFILQ